MSVQRRWILFSKEELDKELQTLEDWAKSHKLELHLKGMPSNPKLPAIIFWRADFSGIGELTAEFDYSITKDALLKLLGISLEDITNKILGTELEIDLEERLV